MADRNGYIGRAPSDSAVTVAKQTFTPTGVTTDFTFASGYTPGYFDLFINGVKMIEGSDFTSPDGSTFSILNGGATNGDVIEAVAYKAFNVATATVGINSAGTPISTQANTLNFVGTGNTFALRGTTVDISISAAGAGGTWTNYDSNAGVSTTKKVKIENDLEVTGVTTSTGGFVGNVTGNATGLSGTPDITVGNITGVAATFSGAVVVGGVLTYDDVTNVDSVGLITARNGIDVTGGNVTIGTGSTVGFGSTAYFRDNAKAIFGDGEDLEIYHDGSNSYIKDVGTGILQLNTNYLQVKNADDNEFILQASQNGAVSLRFDNSQKFATTAGGVNVTGVVTATGSVQVGSGQSFGSNGASAAVYYGDGSNLTGITVGLTTAAAVVSGIVTTLDLSSAQDHKLTVSGITTITCSGGTEGDSHTVRIINSGITTVGFSTFFLFPSGADPSMPTADGAISLISFTVNRVGAGGTQLLAGAALNYS